MRCSGTSTSRSSAGAASGSRRWSTWGTSRAPGWGSRSTPRTDGSGEQRPAQEEGGMAEQTSGEIEIKATPDEVLEVILDFDAYPTWANGVKRCEVTKKDSKGRP